MNFQNLIKLIYLALTNKKIRKLLPAIQAGTGLIVLINATLGINLKIQVHPNPSPIHPPLEQVQPSHKP